MNRATATLLGLMLAAAVRAGTTISPEHPYAWGASIGWINWQADRTNGAAISESYCLGYIYAANVGWIDLGHGPPENGRQFQNNSETDFGVNLDSQGRLRGLAHGANIGWISFEENGAPKVDLRTGNLGGSVYGANVGWISLSNTVAFVQTDHFAATNDSDRD